MNKAPTRAEFDELCSAVGREAASYDLVVVSDGSGTSSASPCGFYAAALRTDSGKVTEHRGALSHGTVNRAELLPMLLALWAHSADFPDGGRVLFVSDSELTVKCGQGVYARNANRDLWDSLTFYERQGWSLAFKHVRRNRFAIQRRCDEQAGGLRRLLLPEGD